MTNAKSSPILYALLSALLLHFGGVADLSPGRWLPTGVHSPIKAGALDVLIVHESADDSQSFGRLVNQLRAGPQAKQLADAGHWCIVLDKDAKLSDGSPDVRLSKWQSELASVKLPALLIADRARNRLLSKQSLPKDATADTVIDAVRKAGGL